jgi:hypothetical protein
MSQQFRKITLALAAGAAIVSLAACGAGMTGEAATSQPTGTNALPSTTATSAPAEDPATETPTEEPTPEDVTLKFGKAFTWENGLSATVSAPKAYKSTDSGFGGDKFKYAVQFTVVIVNKTGKTFDPSMTTANVQSGDVEGEEIFDSANGFNGSPDTKVLNGRQTKFKVAFGVANPKDIVFEFAPGFEYSSQLWTN